MVLCAADIHIRKWTRASTAQSTYISLVFVRVFPDKNARTSSDRFYTFVHFVCRVVPSQISFVAFARAHLALIVE